MMPPYNDLEDRERHTEANYTDDDLLTNVEDPILTADGVRQ